jgi:hypothetical protein
MGTEVNLLDFINKKDQKFYRKNGYVTFSLLSDADLVKLNEIYINFNQNIQKEDPQKYSSAQDISKPKAEEISTYILNLIRPRLKPYFVNLELALAAFLVKPPKQKKEQAIPWHQALTYVDETKYETAMVWIGLEFDKKDNWQFELLPATHKFKDYIRTAPNYPLFVEEYLRYMEFKKVAIQLKPGEALIFNNRLINCSPPNKTNKESRALQIFAKVKGASWLYFTNQEQKIKQYAASTNFFLDLWIKDSCDENAVTNEFQHTFPRMSFVEFLRYLLPFS